MIHVGFPVSGSIELTFSLVSILWQKDKANMECTLFLSNIKQSGTERLLEY